MDFDPLILIDNLVKEYTTYLASSFNFRNKNLRERFLQQLSKTELFKGPYLEGNATFLTGSKIEELIQESILDSSLEKFLFHALKYFKTSPLYLHQEKVIRKVVQGRNVIICSGTGSGKTESFLIPIIDYLLKEYHTGTLTPGVRALLLYPMNALANDQLKRLRIITRSVQQYFPEFNMTFGRYTGDTIEKKLDALRQFKLTYPGEEPAPGELLSREEMRNSPPHILITNYAMLEYLLLRPADSPFFDNEKANSWKFIVVDEVHTYQSAKGIEISMLIRRLKDRVTTDRNKKIQCLAASATLASDEDVLEKIAQFASMLFGETFEYINGEENRQDVVLGKKKSILDPHFFIECPNDIYQTILSILESKIQEEEKVHILKNLLRQTGSQSHNIIETFSHSEECLRYMLENNRQLYLLRKLLETSCKSFEECYTHIGCQPEQLKALIGLGNLSKNQQTGEALFPVKYHFFARMPEGCFVSFYPEIRLFLEAKKKTAEGYAVFELAVCIHCGQGYIFGEIKNGFVVQVNTQNTGDYFYFHDDTMNEIDNDLADETYEDEDSIISNFLTLESKIYTSMYLCIQCGAITSNTTPCPCLQTTTVQTSGTQRKKLIIRIKGKDGKLTKCLACGHISESIARKFYFPDNIPSSIFLTTMFQSFNTTTIQANKKILVFSDNRQRAAFLAPYLVASYQRFLSHSMIYRIFEEHPSEELNLESLHYLLKLENTNIGLFEDDNDNLIQDKMTWVQIYKELCPLDRATSLEGVGLVTFFPKLSQEFKKSIIITDEKINLSLPEWIILIQVLLHTLRNQFIITFPKVISPSDEAFQPKNKEFKIRGENPDKKSGILAWIPSESHKNIRLDYLMKVIGKKYPSMTKDEIKSKSRLLLGVLWEILISWEGMTQIIDRKAGVSFKTNYKFWFAKKSTIESLFYCNSCRQMTTMNIENICPEYNCKGKLIPINVTPEILHDKYYRTMYSRMKPIPIKASEHTAQLETEYAQKIQEQFNLGEINVLSCSTTFELGVDLGGLDLIYLSNVPPEPFNYIQRAGRAGRRRGRNGFVLTFAQRQSHDLTHFHNPTRMIDGQIKTPVLHIINEKILRRHLHSVAISSFWREFPEFFGTVDEFFGLENQYDRINEMITIPLASEQTDNGYTKLVNYLQNKPKHLLESLKRIFPKEFYDVLELSTWGWIEKLFSPDNTQEGTFFKAWNKVQQEYIDLRNYRLELFKKFSDVSLPAEQRNYINASITWSEKRLNTIKKKGIIDFLSSMIIIPKYGFPVDIIELQILQEKSYSHNIRLERDLTMAISEYAPGNKIVANNYLWESYAVKKLKDREWTEKIYGTCQICQNFNIWSLTTKDIPDNLSCKSCRSIFARENLYTFIIPEFGFTTQKDAPVKFSGEDRPTPLYHTQPFIYDYENPIVRKIKITGQEITLKYSRNGKLAVICSGRAEQGFSICGTCGYALSGIPTLKKGSYEHVTALGRECKGKLELHKRFGHIFQTDVLIIDINETKTSFFLSNQYTDDINPKKSFYYSLLYALIFAFSEVFEVADRDINGTLIQSMSGTQIVLYDDVPGGAGHMKRLFEEPHVEQIFLTALKNLQQCSCGYETSCYGCLKTYRNQFCHNVLRKDHVIAFLTQLLHSDTL